MNFSIRKFAGALAVAALLGFGANARAAAITVSSLPSGGTMIAGYVGSFSINVGTHAEEKGTYTSDVYKTSSGKMDFLYQVTLTGGSDTTPVIDSLEMQLFGTSVSGNITEVFAIDSTNYSGGIFGTTTPTQTISSGDTLGGTASAVTFGFASQPLSTLAAGTIFGPSYATETSAGATSAVFVVATDATGWSFGNPPNLISLQDDGSVNEPTFGPGTNTNTSFAPLPASASTGLVMLGGFIGFMGIRRHLTGKPVSA